METTLLAALLALGAAVCFAIGSVAQQGAAEQVPQQEASGVAFLGSLAKDRVWWAGLCGDTAGYGLQVVALLVGPLMLVQPLIVTAVVFAIPLGARWSGRRVSASDLGWAVALCAGLGAFLVIGNPAPGVDHASNGAWLAVGAAVGLLVATCAVAAAATHGVARAALLAVMAGACFGIAAALTKSVVDTVAHDPLAALADPETYGLVVASALGFYYQETAFRAGSLSASLPTMTLVEPVVAAVVGIAILHEHLRADGWEQVVLVLSALVTLVATVVLSRSAAKASTAPG